MKMQSMPRNVSRLLGTPEYIRNAAGGTVTERMYTEEEIFDEEGFPDGNRRIYFGWHRISLSGDEVQENAQQLEIPKKYADRSFFNRAKTARHSEVLVKTVLDLAGVSVDLLSMVLDGDYGAAGIDLLLYSPTLNQYGSFDVAGYDVKMHHKTYFTNSPSTFPKSLRIDNTRAHERKIEACKQKGYLYKGTIHLSVSSGGMLVVLNSTQDDWLTEDNRYAGNGSSVKQEYVAPRSCMYPLAKLVKHYTNNTPALRSLTINDSSNAPLETKLAFLDSLSTVADAEHPDDFDYEDAYEHDRDWYF